MKYEKQPTTVEQQAELLTSRGLIAKDLTELKRYLGSVGYYRLSAYWLPYEMPPADGETRSKKFVQNTDFDDILDVYIFDRKLRLLVMEAIERIEIKLRSRWTNLMTLKHGSHVYLECGHFENAWTHTARVARLTANIERSEEIFNKHYKDKYSTPHMPPLWAVCETMTLTEISKFIDSTKEHSVKDRVARELGLPNRETLAGAIQCLCYIRNICAHHGRLWNRRMVKRPPKIKNFRADMQLQGEQPSNYLYNVLVVICYMVTAENSDTSYPIRLMKLLEGMPEIVLERMGFPVDWRARPVWKTAAS
ncbi:MAG: Abi family protein [Rhizobiaceae bacterium]